MPINKPTFSLFAEDFGVYYYKEIIKNLDNYLNDNGTVIFEIGCKQAQIIKDFVFTIYSNKTVEIIKDYNSLDRISVIKNKG